MEAVAPGQQAYRFNGDLQAESVYLFKSVRFERADGAPPTALTIPTEFYLVLHSRVQITLAGPNVSIPRIPSRFSSFRDAASLPNKKIIGMYNYLDTHKLP